MDIEILKQNEVSEADWEKTPDSVKRLVESLSARIAVMEEQRIAVQSQIERMQEQLNRNSTNSSKSPSSDIEKVERKPQNGKSFAT